MLSKNDLIVIISIIAIIGIINTIVNTRPNSEKELFPGIIGDMILKEKETDISSANNIILYDEFGWNITQGYKAKYWGRNGTMIIFVVQVSDNNSALESLKDMVIRAGYNETKTPGKNDTVVKLSYPQNPEIFLMQKERNKPWHYAFAKLDKIYWIGFDKPNMVYHIEIMKEIYTNIDKTE